MASKRNPRNTSNFDLLDNAVLISAALAVNETDEANADVLAARMAVCYHIQALRYCENGLMYYKDFSITPQMKIEMLAYLDKENLIAYKPDGGEE